MNLKNKHVVITGATGGLGISLACRFVENEVNLHLFIRDQSKGEKLLNELSKLKVSESQKIRLYKLDASSDDVEEKIKVWLSDLEAIDVLINNCAVHGPIGPLTRNRIDDWQRAFNVNFYFPLILSKYVLQKMIPARSGKIINISGGGATSSRPNFSCYAIAKTALVRLTEILSDEVKGYNIEINAVAPGVMPTNLLREILSFNEEQVGKKELETAKSVLEKGESIDQVLDLCVFLASEKSNGITGRLISAKWDNWEVLPSKIEDLTRSDIFKLRRIVPEDRNEKW